MIRFTKAVILMVIINCGYSMPQLKAYGQGLSGTSEEELRIEQNEKAGTISIFRSDSNEPILTQHAREDVRPYIHPIVAPDGKGSLTEYRPKHHLHQTGLYCGLKLVNGRDYFMNFVSCRSAELGLRLPEGWLWQRTMEEAQAFRAATKMSLGSATVPATPPVEVS